MFRISEDIGTKVLSTSLDSRTKDLTLPPKVSAFQANKTLAIMANTEEGNS